jgi:phage head maturation protease
VTIPLVGYAVRWNTPGCPDRGRQFTFGPHCLDRFAASGAGVPLRLDHGPVYSSRGVTGTIGAGRRFRVDRFGLVALAELDATPLGHSLAEQVDRGEWWLSGAYALDFTDPEDWRPHPNALVRHLIVRDIHVEAATLTELSVTTEPSDPGCLALATGERALELFARDDLDQFALTMT